eukprot:gene287-2393_t
MRAAALACLLWSSPALAAEGTASLVPSEGGGLVCLQAPLLMLENVLGLLKTSPLAALYQHSQVVQQTCTTSGYNKSKGVDNCFAPVQLWYKPSFLPAYPGVPKTDDMAADELQLPTIQQDMQQHALCCGQAPSSHHAELVSDSRKSHHHIPPPAPIPTPAGSPMMASHVPDAGLLCNEGPAEFLPSMVAKLKTGSLAGLQQLDGVRNQTCASRGFAVSQGVEDHCYPPAVLWYTGNVFDLYNAEWLEQGAMLGYDVDHGAPKGTGQKIAGCDCLPGSQVRKSLPAGYCDNISPSIPIALPASPTDALSELSRKEDSADASWSARCAFGITNQGGDTVLVGGGSATTIYDDVWSTRDMEHWTQQTQQVGWKSRSSDTVVTLQNVMYAMGGCNGPNIRFNDVYASRGSGSTWTQVTNAAPWSSRCCHATVVFQDQILLLGGHDMKDYANDVWRSRDGNEWSVVVQEAGWSKRDAMSVVVFGEKVFLMAGHDGASGPEQWHNDVWSSADGSTWNLETREADWGRRSAACAVVYDSHIWIMGGWNGDLLNDVWKSADGVIWTQVTASAPWDARWWFSALVVPQGVIVVGGMTTSYEPLGDVWLMRSDQSWEQLQ